ncbi:hypothetical protein BS17DRAFT_776158 [Gyrodon lividus]|nr:hypothetical protein BS17DRAFT_776158 [Gyrodon lividus]
MPEPFPSKSKWSIFNNSRKGKEREYDQFRFPQYPAAAYGYSYYPQVQPSYPGYYAPVQMAVVQPIGVQQPLLAMPQAYVPVAAYQTTAVQPVPFAQPAPAVPVLPTAQMPAPTVAPPPPVLAQPTAPVQMPEPFSHNSPAPAEDLVIPPMPMSVGSAAAVPPPPIIEQPQPAPGSTRPRFTDFYRPAGPSVSQPGPSVAPADVPLRPPTAPPFVTPMRNNPLPPPPADVWGTSPYRQVLANLPNDLTMLLDPTNRDDILVQGPPEPSLSRLGSLFGSRRDKGKKPRKGLFRSLSTSGHDILNDFGSSSSSRHGHHHAPTVTSMVIPAPGGSSMPHPSVPAAPQDPVMPVPDRGPPVKFDHTGEFAGFVNHSRHRVLYKNKMYPTALHLLEAMKFPERPDLQERIRTCTDVTDMYPLSASFQEHVRPDWGQVFLKTMEEVLFFKFKQHPNLRTILLGTGLADIVYADANSYWGEGPLGEGANELGKALVRVRERLCQEGDR